MYRYYLPKHCNHSCSNHSITVIYNYINKSDCNENNFYHFFPFLEETLPYNKQPMETIKERIDQIFQTNSKIKNKESLSKELTKSFVILFLRDKESPQLGHYTPILESNQNRILIGEPTTHQMEWLSIQEIWNRMDDNYLQFIPFN
jgi:hypothetical protein